MSWSYMNTKIVCGSMQQFACKIWKHFQELDIAVQELSESVKEKRFMLLLPFLMIDDSIVSRNVFT